MSSGRRRKGAPAAPQNGGAHGGGQAGGHGGGRPDDRRQWEPREPERRAPEQWTTEQWAAEQGPAEWDDAAPPPRRRSGGTAGNERGTGARTEKTGKKVRRPDPEPMETDDVKIVAYGTLIWAIAFLALLPFRHTLDQHDHGWWLYTCLAGAGLGLVGLHLVRRRRAAMEQSRQTR